MTDESDLLLKRILLAQERTAHLQELQATATASIRDELAAVKLNFEEGERRVRGDFNQLRIEVLDVRRRQSLLEGRVGLVEVAADKATIAADEAAAAVNESSSADRHASPTTALAPPTAPALSLVASPSPPPVTGPHPKVDTSAMGGEDDKPVFALPGVTVTRRGIGTVSGGLWWFGSKVLPWILGLLGLGAVSREITKREERKPAEQVAPGTGKGHTP